MAICPICNEEKPLTEFYTDNTRVNGHGTYCKACVSANKKAHYQTQVRSIPKMSPDELRAGIDMRAAQVDNKPDDWCMRWIGPTRSPRAGTQRSAIKHLWGLMFPGLDFPRSYEMYCDNKSWCINVLHIVEKGEVLATTAEDAFSESESEDGVEFIGWNVGHGEKSLKRQNPGRTLHDMDTAFDLREIEDSKTSIEPGFSAPIDAQTVAFLKEHDLNWKGEPLRHRKETI